jgi:hypothetical protein
MCEHSPKKLEKKLRKCELSWGFSVITGMVRVSCYGR